LPVDLHGVEVPALGWRRLLTVAMGINPQARLTEVIGLIADHKTTRIDEFLPWRYAADAA
jgi:hypothetical protein